LVEPLEQVEEGLLVGDRHEDGAGDVLDVLAEADVGAQRPGRVDPLDPLGADLGLEQPLDLARRGLLAGEGNELPGVLQHRIERADAHDDGRRLLGARGRRGQEEQQYRQRAEPTPSHESAPSRRKPDLPGPVYRPARVATTASCAPLAPRGRGAGGEGGRTVSAACPLTPTPLPRGARGFYVVDPRGGGG